MSRQQKQRSRTLRFVFGTAAVIWCAVIFCLSAQSGIESSETSGRFIEQLCRIFMPEFIGFDDASRAAVISRLQFIVRKGAHFTAYAVLAFLMMQVFLALLRPRSLPMRVVAAWGACVFYAVTDEVHQYFVPGRAMQIRDIVIDSCGAMFGILISLAVSRLIRKKQLRNNLRRSNI